MKQIPRIIIVALFLIGYEFELKGQIHIEKIWTNLNSAVGNRYVYPDLEVMRDDRRGPAYFRDGVVYFDSVFINHLFSNHDSSFVKLSIAYLFSHELGHYYLNHTDTHIKSMAYAKTSSKSVILSGDSRKQDLLFKESEADLYGGLYSTQAGYYALDIAEQFLTIVYDYYELPKELPGYPSLSDRIEVANNLKSIVQNINESYQIALALAYLGEHSTSQYILKSIIRDTKFQTPEILHLLSYSIFLDATANVDNKSISTWSWPVDIPFDAYKKNETRGVGTNSIVQNLEEARAHELNALNLEKQTSSNLLECIDLVLSHEVNQLDDYQLSAALDSSLISLYYALTGKKKKSTKYLGRSRNANGLQDENHCRIENLNWSPITSDILFELRFSHSENIVLNRKRIAKKFPFHNIYLYELKSFDGVGINLIREDIKSDSVKSCKFPIKNNNSVYFYQNNETIKFQLE